MRNWLAVGLMSGTSMDGVDAALTETDGGAHSRLIAFRYTPYPEPLRDRLRAAMSWARSVPRPKPDAEIGALEADVTAVHADAVRSLLVDAGARPELIGFHGQTIMHRPDLGWTWQLGDGCALARSAGVRTIYDFRRADMAAGGQGAPLLPVFHRAKLGEMAGTDVAILNLGGVGNITWLGANLGDWLSFDTGPANALIDDWVQRTTGARWDEGGALAAGGRTDEAALAALSAHPYFARPAPKSLDRNEWTVDSVDHLGAEDGAATLTAFSAEAVRLGLDLCPRRPRRLLVTGGGRLNATLMRELAERTGVAVEAVEAVGWNGDALEAEAFAYFAVRRVTDRPITFPETTGCREPTVGGVICDP